jgi:hypothetical protein
MPEEDACEPWATPGILVFSEALLMETNAGFLYSESSVIDHRYPLIHWASIVVGGLKQRTGADTGGFFLRRPPI